MSWPLISDFSRMLQTPQAAFRDPALKQCRIEMDQLGQPRPRSGNFATVYRATLPSGQDQAIRVFNRKADERRDRYAACSSFFSSSPLNCIVGFRYEEQGIRSAADGKLYPLVVMDWVEGVTLFEWVRDRCREGYRDALQIGADVWLKLVRELQGAGVAHGDLQHANIMVTPQGYFKLVDYDCLAVPSLMGQRNIELGLPPYQHPQRNAETLLFPGLDNYSALLIYTAIKALAAAPHLWFAYVENLGYDKILFRPEDFQDPAQSRLYYELLNSSDRLVRDLAHNLFQLSRYPIADVPPVDEVLLWCQPLDELIGAAQWDKVVQLVKRMGPTEQIAPHLQPHVQSAHQRVAARAALEEAYAKGDETELQRLYRPELFENYPDAADIALKASQAAQARRALEVLRSARQLRAWDMFRQTWTANQQLLENRPSASSFREDWEKLHTVDVLIKFLEDPNSDDQQVIDSWRRIQSWGGHPLAESCRPAVDKRVGRQAALIQWRREVAALPPSPTLETDRALISAWPAAEFEGWGAAIIHRAALDAAAGRLKEFNNFQRLATCAGPEIEKQVLASARLLSEDYHPAVAKRIAEANQRVGAGEQLQAAIEQAESEEAVIRAWEKLRRAGGNESAPQAIRDRVKLARTRLPLLDSLGRLSPHDPPDALDQKLLEIWDVEVLNSCREAQPWRERFELAHRRSEAISGIQAAAESGDLDAALRLAGSDCFEGVALPREIRARIEELKQTRVDDEARHRQALVNSLLNNQRRQFVEQFDLAMLREICRDAAHHKQVVEHWTESEVLPDFCSTARKSDHSSAGVKVKESPRFHAHWNWPAKYASVRCRFKVCSPEHSVGERSLPDDLESVYDAPIYRRGWQADDHGHTFVADPQWNGHHVLLWGVFDFGFQILHSPPIDLGVIEFEKEKPKKRWGIF